MSVYDETKHHKDRIMQDAILIAYAVMSIQGRVEDEVSTNEAYRLYDRGWVKDRTDRGLLHYIRKGAEKNSAKVYSRFEIEALKRAEKEVADAYDMANARLNELKNEIQNDKRRSN